MGIRCADHVTPLYPQKLALTSPTGGGRSVVIVRSRTKATEIFYCSDVKDACRNACRSSFEVSVSVVCLILIKNWNTATNFRKIGQKCHMHIPSVVLKLLHVATEGHRNFNREFVETKAIKIMFWGRVRCSYCS